MCRRVAELCGALVVFDQDRIIRAGLHAFGATITARRLDVWQLVHIYLNDGACIANQAGMAGVAILAQVPVDNR